MFTDYIIKMAPKVLTQVDRDKDSLNYGDCDRNHWHLKVRDFSSAILQQTGLTIALLYGVDFEGNIFYQKEEVREWAEATVHYWKKIQLRDGSFNEYYPNEHGFPPTAFSLYAMCEVYKRLSMEDAEILKAFEKTAKYLIKHIEPKAYNQELASVTALYSAYTILQEKWILEGLNRKLDRILKLQSEEGWFSEYGGADIGYLSVSLDMLAEYYWMSKDEKVVEPLNRIVSFLQYFVHPDKTAGGEYASRNTIYFLPGGLQTVEILGNRTATAILNHLYGDTTAPFYFLDAVDDRYFSHYLLHSFLRAVEKRPARRSQEGELLPFQYQQRKIFPEAGLLAYTEKDKYIIISAAKGGVCRVFRNGQASFEDYGYRVKLAEGKVAATNWQRNDYHIEYLQNKIKISGNMNVVKQKVSTPIMHLGLRTVSALVGNKIIGFLKNQIILVNKQSDIHFERVIILEEHEMIIDDTVSSPVRIHLQSADSFSLRHVASGKFFALTDIGNHSRKDYGSIQKIHIKRIFTYDTEEWKEEVEQG